jgi:hypothetical protein
MNRAGERSFRYLSNRIQTVAAPPEGRISGGGGGEKNVTGVRACRLPRARSSGAPSFEQFVERRITAPGTAQGTASSMSRP